MTAAVRHPGPARRDTRIAVARVLGRQHRHLPGVARHDDAVRGLRSRCAHAFAGATTADLSWVLNAYTVVYATMLIPAGGLADTHGRKHVFLIGVALFLAASAACGLAGSVGWLIAARVLQAVGAALLTPASLSIVLAAFPQSKRAVVVSLWGAVGGLAAAVARAPGSFVVDTVGWPWAFYINLPLGALSLVARRVAAEGIGKSGARRRVDGVGMALLMRGGGCRHPGHRAVRVADLEPQRTCWSLGATGLVAPAPSWRGRARPRRRWWTWRCSTTAPTAT